MSTHFAGPASKFIFGCWIVFVVFWWSIAALTKRTAERQSIGSEARHRLPLWGAALLLVFSPRWSLAGWNHLILAPTRLLMIVGAAVTLAGLALAIWARIVLGGNWSSAVTFKQGHELIVSGPYRWVRNPIYTAMLLMFLGTALAEDRPLGFVALALAAGGLWIKLKQEERLLQTHFPSSFPAYRARVKALIPFVL